MMKLLEPRPIAERQWACAVCSPIDTLKYSEAHSNLHAADLSADLLKEIHPEKGSAVQNSLCCVKAERMAPHDHVNCNAAAPASMG